METDDLTASLIRRLISATESGNVDWSAESDTSFRVETAHGRVEIASVEDDGGHPYWVGVYNGEGKLVGSGETILGQAYSPWENEIEKLYVLARNNALGVQKTFDEIANDLLLPGDPADDVPF